MLKKAGILTAAIAASMLAVSPLAFAGGADHDSKSDHKSDKDHKKKKHDNDDDDKDKDHHKKKKHDGDDDDKDRHHKKDPKKDPKPVVSTDNQSTDCRFAAAGSATSSANRSTGLLSLAGLDVVGSVAGNVIPQVPIASCNNIDVSDVLDFGSNNRETTVNPAPV